MRVITSVTVFSAVVLAAGCGRSFAFVPVAEGLADGGGAGVGEPLGGGPAGRGDCTGAPPTCLLPPPGCRIAPACSGTTWGCSADCPDGGERQPGGGMGGMAGMDGGGMGGTSGMGGLGGIGGMGGGEGGNCPGAPPSFACAGGCLGTVQCAAGMWATSCFCPSDGGACGEDPCSPCPDGCMTVAACLTGGGGGGFGAMGGGWDCACVCGGGGGF